MERRAHPSQNQLEILLKFLEDQPSLAKGFSKIASARQHAHGEWSKLALKLNSEGSGCVKSPKRWMKYWSDKKSAVKKKAAIRTGQRRQTGGGIAEIVHLTEWEERIISLMGGDRFYDGDPSLRVHPFSGPTSSSSGSIRIFTPPHSIAPVTLIGPTSSSSGSIRIFTPPHSIAPVTLIGPTSSSSGSIRIFTPPHSIEPVTLIEPSTSTTSNINLDIQENPTIAENINDNTVHSLVNSVVETSNFAEQPQLGSQGLTPSRPRCVGSEYAESQARRRLRLQPSQPSQRRNYLNSTTEKFLRIEEQRLDLDTKILDLLNKQSIRDHLLLQTVNNGQQAIIEGQNAIAEAQNAIAEALKAIAMAINK